MAGWGQEAGCRDAVRKSGRNVRAMPHPWRYVILSSVYRFRWVFCQMEVLQHCITASIRQILEHLPESLDETYARVLSQIPLANQAHAHRLLQCLMVAIRPLRVEELAELLAFEFGTAQGAVPKYRADWSPNDQVQAVLSTCSSLISIVGYPGFQVVQFSHFSVKEFLMSDRLTSSLGDFSRYQINPGPAHTIIAQACLGFFLHLDDHVNRESVKGFPLAEYATKHWVTHAQFEGVALRVKDGIESLFDCNKRHLAAWIRINNIEEGFHWLSPSTPLYYSSLCGFSDLVEHLANKHPKHVNAIGGRYEFPMFAALFRKHVRVAKILLKHGANVDIWGMESWLPLRDALRDVTIVQFLLNHGADVNFRRDDLRTPLHLAARYGELEVARVLLLHKADVGSRDDKGMIPLHLLFEENFRYDDKIVHFARLLLKHGADVNRRDEVNNTPLHLTRFRANHKCARFLLEHGADPGVENDRRQTPLHMLFENYIGEGSILDLTRFSLKHGVDVNIRTTNEGTLLHSAAFNGWLAITRLLLDRGANADTEHDEGETPLNLVSRGRYGFPGYGSEEDAVGVTRLLLERGVDVNAQDKNKTTPLHSAAFRGGLEVAKVLLNHGANTSAENDKGETPLHLVSQGGRYSKEGGDGIVWLLLERGEDVNAQTKNGWTPLHWAAINGELKTAQVLLFFVFFKKIALHSGTTAAP